MNKSEMKLVMESIEKKLKSEKSFTSMGSNKRAWDVLEEIYKSGQTKFIFNGVQYDLAYHPSHPTIGGRSSSPEYVVTRYSAKKMFDVDDMLAKKEIVVRHFHGGAVKEFEEPIMLIDTDHVLSIVKTIMSTTTFNVMIQRHDTGDVTIWVDEGKFRQR